MASVLGFRRLPVLARIRYLMHAARCLTIRDWRHLDQLKATDWLRSWLGERGYQALWHKLFAFKFYHYSERISAAWMWSRIRRLGQSSQRLKETLGFLAEGSQQLIDAMQAQLNARGCELRLGTPVQALRPRSSGGAIIATAMGEEIFDIVISTIPLPLLAPILRAGDVDEQLVERYASLPSVACACVILKIRQSVTANFWTNTNDQRLAIPGVIEMSNLRPLRGHVVYVPFYIPADHPDYQRSNEAFIVDAWQCIKAINPEIVDSDFLASHCSRYRYAQPVCGIHFQQSLPPTQSFPGVYTVDTTAYYPEDRGISESIDFGRRLARQACGGLL